MEEWSKQADQTKFEGSYHMLHKESKRIENSRNIFCHLRPNFDERHFLTLYLPFVWETQSDFS